MPPKMGPARKSNNDKRSELLGPSKDMIKDDLPTLRCCLRYGMYLKEQAMGGKEELEVQGMIKEVCKKVVPLYLRANAKLCPPVIMNVAVFAQKLTRIWIDINTILRKQKNWLRSKKKLEAQLDKLFDMIYCQCSISCVGVITCTTSNCTHEKIMCCEKVIKCTLDNCPHKKIRVCVKDIRGGRLVNMI